MRSQTHVLNSHAVVGNTYSWALLSLMVMSLLSVLS